MKLFMNLIFGLFVLACAPSTNSSTKSNIVDPVEQQNYNALTQVKWCETPIAQQDFVISWKFNSDLTLRWLKQKIDTSEILGTKLLKWNFENKVLVIRDSSTNTILLSQEMTTSFDTQTGLRKMSWTEVSDSNSQCTTTGACNSQSLQATNLSECN